MDSKEAIELVAEKVELNEGEEFNVTQLDDYTNFWYITKTTCDEATLVGGYAYAVNIETRRIFSVPGNMPAHFNLRSILEGDAIELG